MYFVNAITVLDNQWDVKYRDGLQGVIAFTKWNIPQKEAFAACRELTFILGVSPVLGQDMSAMFCEASKFNKLFQGWDTSSVTSMGIMFDSSGMKNIPTWYK